MTKLRARMLTAIATFPIGAIVWPTEGGAQTDCNRFPHDRRGNMQQGICVARNGVGTTRDAITRACEAAIRCGDAQSDLGHCHLARNVCKGIADPRCDHGGVDLAPDDPIATRNAACRAPRASCNTAPNDLERRICDEIRPLLGASPAPASGPGVPPATPLHASNCTRFPHNRDGNIEQGICVAMSGAIPRGNRDQIAHACESAILEGPSDLGDVHLARNICKGVAESRCDAAGVDVYNGPQIRNGACRAWQSVCTTAPNDGERAICADVQRLWPNATQPQHNPISLPQPDPRVELRGVAPPRPAGYPKEAVWGMVDTHFHQFNHVGSGGEFLRGATHDLSGSRPCDPMNPADLRDNAACAMSLALRRCDRAPDGNIAGHGPGGAIDFTSGTWFHGTLGWPRFDGWPSASTVNHQRAYIDWVKRAFRAGLQLAVVPLGSAEPFCTNARTTYASCRDMYAVDKMIDFAFEFERYVAEHDGGWYKIVKTPAEARAAIAGGKMAVVLGVEVDSLFDCPLLKGDPRAGQPNMLYSPNRDRTGINNNQCSKDWVTKELERYYARGIRQFFPIAHFDNQFGGASIYNEMFDVGQYAVSTVCQQPDSDTAQCAASGVDFSYGLKHLDAKSFGAVALGNAIHGNVQYACGDRYPASSGPSCNSRGLTPLGEHLIREMMRLKVIFDVDHMSNKSFDGAIKLAKSDKEGPYPVLSGHAGFRDLGFSVAEAKSQKGLSEAIGMMRHESMKSGRMIDEIADLGGFVGAIVEPSNNRRFAGKDNPVANDCPGSSKSWAQNYLYLADRMHFRGVGFGTESNGFTPMPGARFSAKACDAVDTSTGALLGIPGIGAVSREDLAARQDAEAHDRAHPTPRVKYKAPRVAVCDNDGSDRGPLGHARQGVCMARRTAGTSFGEVNSNCLAQAGAPCVTGDCHLRSNVCRGARMGFANQSCDDQTFEPLTPFGAAQRRGACRAAKRQSCDGVTDSEERRSCQLVKDILDDEQDGIEPVVAGTKVFDYNTDGFAHYGMLPDFIMDLRNVGLTDRHLEPLYRSAEDFLVMWEKIEGTRKRGPWR